MREVIAYQAIKLFFANGVKSITMNDVARNMGISKKTLYQIFKDKDDMLLEGLHQKQYIGQFFIDNPSKNIFEALYDCADNITRIGEIANIQSILDLKRYHPSVYDVMIQNIEKYIYKCSEKTLKAIEKGYINEDVSVEFVQSYLRYTIFNLFNSQLTDKYNCIHIAKSVCFFAKGIATSKGERYLKRLKCE